MLLAQLKEVEKMHISPVATASSDSHHIRSYTLIHTLVQNTEDRQAPTVQSDVATFSRAHHLCCHIRLQAFGGFRKPVGGYWTCISQDFDTFAMYTDLHGRPPRKCQASISFQISRRKSDSRLRRADIMQCPQLLDISWARRHLTTAISIRRHSIYTRKTQEDHFTLVSFVSVLFELDPGRFTHCHSLTFVLLPCFRLFYCCFQQ